MTHSPKSEVKNKVFSLVAQEEKQRAISSQFTSGNNDSANSMAFVARNESFKRPNTDAGYSGSNRFQKKEEPYCSHCNFQGHTVDRCYKLHGYPPGYK